jgi:hypothetical protein
MSPSFPELLGDARLRESAVISIIADIQRRSAHIYWPDGIVPERADLFAHNEVVIAAPPGKIWHHLIRPTAWPEWYSNASDVAVNASGGLPGRAMCTASRSPARPGGEPCRPPDLALAVRAASERHDHSLPLVPSAGTLQIAIASAASWRALPPRR